MDLWDFEKYRERIAVITEQDKEYRYGEIYEFQKEIARHIEKRSLVCMAVGNDMGSLMGYLACVVNDSVPLLVSAQIRKADMLNMVETYMPEYIWIPTKSDYLAAGQGYIKIFSYWDYELWERMEKCGQQLNSELALLLPTSGSTGNPKLVRLSRGNIQSNTKSICEYLKLSETERAVTSLPMSYTYGLSIIHTFLHVGASIYITGQSVCRKSFWTGVKKHQVTFFAGVPYTYESMKRMGIREQTLESLTKLTQAGGRLSNELQMYWGEFACKTNKEFYVMYGQTEATARISYLPPEYCLDKIGSVGIPIPGCQIQIAGEGNTIEVPQKIGEIVCKGQNVSMGYGRERSDLAKGDENNGILYTGDLGYRDNEGFIYIRGRKSRFGKLYGKRVDLAYLEIQLECDLQIYAVLLSDDKRIFIYTDSEKQQSAAEYIQLKTGFPNHVLECKGLTELPRNEYGKINYSCHRSR